MTEATETRSVELEVTIDAPVEAVWKALSDAAELVRWFAPEAKVKPGVGGTIWISWGEGMAGEGRIRVWEPNRRLVWSEGEAPAGATPILVDFEIEGRAGSTVVRLVHSGFGASADWDEQYNATKAGWTYFLFNLAFYLARHRGRSRQMVSSRRRTRRSFSEIWNALLGKEGLEATSTTPDQPFRITLGGASHTGEVKIASEPRSFAGTLTSLNDGLIFIEMEPGAEAWHCGVWISLYDVAKERVQEVQTALDGVMDRVFAEA